jgi:hypothetical protein
MRVKRESAHPQPLALEPRAFAHLFASGTDWLGMEMAAPDGLPPAADTPDDMTERDAYFAEGG